MRHNPKGLGACLAAAVVFTVAGIMPGAEAASERPLFVSLGANARAPIGWTEFCAGHVQECEVRPLEARDIVLTQKSWRELLRINNKVNAQIKPMTDLDHWGVVER